LQGINWCRFLENVNSAYAHANASLLDLLLTTHALPARLRSLKHYFFLDRADFFHHFLEMGHTELQKPAKKVNVSKLQSLFDLALRQPGSIAASDPFKEDVKVSMNEVDLTKWLMRVVNVSGVDEGAMSLDATTHQAASNSTDDRPITGYYALELDYGVPFPLSLVISRKTVLRYQLLFRHLLSLRHLESQLCSAWRDHTTVYTWKHRSQYPEVERWKRRAWTLRARMLVFVQQLLYFCTMEVVEPNWAKLMKRLDEVKTVDELMQHHVDFLDTCLKECMLTNAKLLKVCPVPLSSRDDQG
jgi:gamma-tubulin complex component 2